MFYLQIFNGIMVALMLVVSIRDEIRHPGAPAHYRFSFYFLMCLTMGAVNFVWLILNGPKEY